MAQTSRKGKGGKSPYTADRGMPGAYEGETVTRRGLFAGGAMAAGGIATAAFGLPALGFALGPIFSDSTLDAFQDVGPETAFNDTTYVSAVITLTPGDIGEAGKTTVYIRKSNPEQDKDKLAQPYVAISTRCAHLGCPVRWHQASEKFICPCHGGAYGSDGKVETGPPVRPLDRFETRVEGGRVFVGQRFSVNSKLERHKPRDPAQPLDGLWQYLYPARPTT